MSIVSIPAVSRRILVIDDDLDSVEIIAEALSWEGYQVERASNRAAALNLVENWNPDVVLLDMSMSTIDSLALLKKIREAKSYIMVMFISGKSSTEDVIEGLDAGADDYVPKPFDPLELLARVRTQLRIKDLNDELRRANHMLQEMVETDDLTGLLNMRSVFQRLDSELDRARRFNRQVCVVMMDLDQFKSVNDGHDHLFGSYVLSEVGRIIKESIRSIDMAARYGGDEFLILLTETGTSGAVLFCERLRNKISQHLFKNDKDEMKLTASLGFATSSAGDMVTDSKALVRFADNALYDAKRSGRNCVRYIEIEAPAPRLLKASGRKSR